MGFASLGILASVVRATLGIRWEEDGEMTNALAVIDTDIGQAIQVSVNVPAALTHLTWLQSSREEIESGRIADFGAAREALDTLRSAVKDSFQDVAAWGGEFPFERASFSIEFLKV
jgi:hypothetical protein